MGKSVLTVDARFSVCISLTPSHLMMPGLDFTAFAALCFSRGWDRQLPALRKGVVAVRRIELRSLP